MDLLNTKFGSLMTRSNKNIRDDRGLAIIEDAELEYKRDLENKERDLKKLYRRREAMLDFSPGNTYQLTPEKFDAAKFVDDHRELGLQIRNMEITLEVLRKGYKELFETPEPAATVVA